MRRTILIVDDEECICFALKRYFERRGFLVDVASELEEAEALLGQNEYSVMLVDLRLTGAHGVEGLELLRRVREGQPWVKCVLLSAYATAEVERAAMERGAARVLRKPIALPELGELVASLIEA